MYRRPLVFVDIMFVPMLILGLFLSFVAFSQADTKLPHILFVIVDDLGWADTGFHRETPTPEIVTPTIDSLVRGGVELNRHYVHMTCTPTRSSFQSGRLPAHVLLELAHACDEHGAIPRNMTGIASVMKKAGYATHQVGKWDCGMVTPAHTPKGRGYDTSLGYFDHGNWMYTSNVWEGSYDHRPDIPEVNIIDLWDTDRPAKHLNGTGFEEYIFCDRVLEILKQHDQSTPLFLNYDSRMAHYPLQAPPEYQEKFSFITYENRRVYAAMVNFLDDVLANITDTFKELGMWDNTLMVFSSDNGGFVRDPAGTCNVTDARSPGASPSSDIGHGTACHNGEAGANNWPLRGGKYSNWEGGIRANAFMSGGFLPEVVRGTRQDGVMHIADWYRTLSEGIAGVDPTDVWAAESDLPPIDSLNMWPMLSGETNLSPRDKTGFIVTPNLFVKGQWKYVAGGTTMIGDACGGPQYPNETTVIDPIGAWEGNHHFKCPAQGCLYNVVEDLFEEHEVSAQYPEVVQILKAELAKQAATVWETTHNNVDACDTAARSLYGGYYGPWEEVGDWQSLVSYV